jgi:ArsR family transcriptional regulator
MVERSALCLRVKILSALSDPTRLEILNFLAERERCVCEILPSFQRSQSTISKHLNILYEAGILDRRIDGKRTLYRIKNPRIVGLMREVDAIALDQIAELEDAGRILEASIR